MHPVASRQPRVYVEFYYSQNSTNGESKASDTLQFSWRRERDIRGIPQASDYLRNATRTLSPSRVSRAVPFLLRALPESLELRQPNFADHCLPKDHSPLSATLPRVCLCWR